MDPVLVTDPAHLWRRFVRGVREGVAPVLAKQGLVVPIVNPRGLTEEQGRAVVKAASTYVWANLSEGLYKDRPHIQSVHAFMTGTFTVARLCCAHTVVVVAVRGHAPPSSAAS